MNNKLKKIVALCLAFAMVATVVLPESAYAKTKKTANYVTRAYVLQQVEKLIGATQTSDDVIQIKDVKKSSPYYKTMSIAVNAGLVKRPISMSHQFLQKFLRQAPKTCWERRQQRQN